MIPLFLVTDSVVHRKMAIACDNYFKTECRSRSELYRHSHCRVTVHNVTTSANSNSFLFFYCLSININRLTVVMEVTVKTRCSKTTSVRVTNPMMTTCSGTPLLPLLEVQ